jgi:hypothetical protein
MNFLCLANVKQLQKKKRYLHCVIYSKVHRHCKQVHHSDSFAIMLWLLSYNLHRMCPLDVLHFVAIAVSEREKKMLFKLIIKSEVDDHDDEKEVVSRALPNLI